MLSFSFLNQRIFIASNIVPHFFLFLLNISFLSSCATVLHFFFQREIASSMVFVPFYDTCARNSIMFENRITCLETELTIPLKRIQQRSEASAERSHKCREYAIEIEINISDNNHTKNMRLRNIENNRCMCIINKKKTYNHFWTKKISTKSLFIQIFAGVNPVLQVDLNFLSVFSGLGIYFSDDILQYDFADSGSTNN